MNDIVQAGTIEDGKQINACDCPMDDSSRKQDQALDHVYWLGGSPCAGKSSISTVLAREHGLRAFSVDKAFSHRNRVNPKRQPTLHKWATTSWNELWMQPEDVLLDEAKSAYGEHFELISQDVRRLLTGHRVLIEGTALLPDKVHRLGVDPRRAVWLVPTEDFQRTRYPVRGDWVHLILKECQDPKQALENWMDRDVAFAKWVTERTQALDLRLMRINGARTVEQYASLVAQYFQLQ